METGMIEIRFHGVGGQGAVIASKILAVAAFNEGKYPQSFPAFGLERRGAPVMAFSRIDDRKILLRTAIYEPDMVVVLEPALLNTQDITQGLKKGGAVLISTTSAPSAYKSLGPFRIATVDAQGIAVACGLGTPTSPIVNTAILGALSRFTGCVKLESVIKAIRDEIPYQPEKNVEAAERAYREVRME
jgi:pyruvate ferredoxin oxidoreductase gamma subunit